MSRFDEKLENESDRWYFIGDIRSDSVEFAMKQYDDFMEKFARIFRAVAIGVFLVVMFLIFK